MVTRLRNTPKISEETIKRLTEIQQHLEQKGIKIPQQELLDRIMEYITRREETFLETFGEEDDIDPLEKWLQELVPGKKSDAVKEHDLVE